MSHIKQDNRGHFAKLESLFHQISALEVLLSEIKRQFADVISSSSDGEAYYLEKLAIQSRHSNKSDPATSGTSRDFLRVPIGKTLGGSDVFFCLGEESDCNHAFILGVSGSGKSTFLNNLIVGIAERYSSDELRLFLIDGMAGLEFQEYSEHPNCEKIVLGDACIDAAQELLEHFLIVIKNRGGLFRAMGANNINSYNDKADQRLPRLLLIVDDAWCLFTSDAKGRKFQELLKDVMCRGLAFGVHIVLSAQTLINSNVDKDLMAQIALRIAFKLTNDTDCDRIFNYNNTEPRNLSKFEFVYNADSGNQESNIRVGALPPPQIAERIAAVRAHLSAGMVLTPDVVKSCEESVALSPVLQPDQQQSCPAWLIDSRSEERAAKDQRANDILMQVRAMQAGGNWATNLLAERKAPLSK